MEFCTSVYESPYRFDGCLHIICKGCLEIYPTTNMVCIDLIEGCIIRSIEPVRVVRIYRVLRGSLDHGNRFEPKITKDKGLKCPFCETSLFSWQEIISLDSICRIGGTEGIDQFLIEKLGFTYRDLDE